MLRDIIQLTQLYLQAKNLMPEDQSWSEFHDELVLNIPINHIGLLADAAPKGKCKYALFVNVDTKTATCKVSDYQEVDSLDDWSSHLFWQGSGGAQSDNVRNAPHKLYSTKKTFSVDDLAAPIQTIIDDYCHLIEGQGKKKKVSPTGPLFWHKDKITERDWLNKVVKILSDSKTAIEIEVKGGKIKDSTVVTKFPSIKPGELVFVGLTIDGKPIGFYEIFRRYLLFVRTRAGIQKGAERYKNRQRSDVKREIGVCPLCGRSLPLLDQWQGPAELSFYQTTNDNHLSREYPSEASYKLCQGCVDLLFVFKQRVLETSTRSIGGYDCFILPSIKMVPGDRTERKRLYEPLEKIWEMPSESRSVERRLLYRLANLPSYATVSFIFGNYITAGKSQNVRRMDELNVAFHDVPPSRLSKVAEAIEGANNQLHRMWSLTGRTWQCSWGIQGDFYLLYGLFHPVWEDKQKDKSRRRAEIERYLKAIFFGEKIPYDDVAEDCYSNLISAFVTSRSAAGSEEDLAKYALQNYSGNVLSLLVLLEKLLKPNNLDIEVNIMNNDTVFEFSTMPDLGKFVCMHPLLQNREYLAPFFVGCLFSYAEWLQKDNSRLAAYNWLGTMALSYDDIMQGIYPKLLNYITAKEKLVSSPRLGELMKAVAYYDSGKCSNDRVALVAFCHGWALGRSFIMKKDLVKAIRQKFKELAVTMDDSIKAFLEANKDSLNSRDPGKLDELVKLVPDELKEKISSTWYRSGKDKIFGEGGDSDGD